MKHIPEWTQDDRGRHERGRHRPEDDRLMIAGTTLFVRSERNR
jgi:hypothetical protein